MTEVSYLILIEEKNLRALKSYEILLCVPEKTLNNAVMSQSPVPLLVLVDDCNNEYK